MIMVAKRPAWVEESERYCGQLLAAGASEIGGHPGLRVFRTTESKIAKVALDTNNRKALVREEDALRKFSDSIYVPRVLEVSDSPAVLIETDAGERGRVPDDGERLRRNMIHLLG